MCGKFSAFKLFKKAGIGALGGLAFGKGPMSAAQSLLSKNKKPGDAMKPDAPRTTPGYGDSMASRSFLQ